MPHPATPAVTLTAADLLARYGLGRSAVYRAIRDRGFPAPLKLGRRSFWIAAECDRWFSALAAERDRAPAPDDSTREAHRRAGLASAAARAARRAAAALDTTA